MEACQSFIVSPVISPLHSWTVQQTSKPHTTSLWSNLTPTFLKIQLFESNFNPQRSQTKDQNRNMSWTRPVVAFSRGAVITLGSTAVSCMLAIQVERSAHRLLFSVAPHLYASVDHAYGLSEEDLQYARQVAQQRELNQIGALAKHFAVECVPLTAEPSLRRPNSEDPSNLFKLRVPNDEERILESAPL